MEEVFKIEYSQIVACCPVSFPKRRFALDKAGLRLPVRIGYRSPRLLPTVLAACQQHQRNAVLSLTVCCCASFKTAIPPALSPQPG